MHLLFEIGQETTTAKIQCENGLDSSIVEYLFYSKVRWKRKDSKK